MRARGGGARRGDEARPGGRLVRRLCRCSWPAGSAWAATARPAVRLGRRPDGCALRREKKTRAHTPDSRWRAGGREASARTFIYIIIIIIIAAVEHTRILYYIRGGAHTYIVPCRCVCVCVRSVESGRRRRRLCVGGNASRGAVGGVQRKYELARAHTHTHTCGRERARRPHIFSYAAFPHRPLSETVPPRNQPAPPGDRPTTTPVTSARLAPQPPIRLDAPRPATTFFFLPARPTCRNPAPRSSRSAVFVSVPFFALFFFAPTTRRAAATQSASEYEKTISRAGDAVDVKLSRDFIPAFFSLSSFFSFLFSFCFSYSSSFPRFPCIFAHLSRHGIAVLYIHNNTTLYMYTVIRIILYLNRYSDFVGIHLINHTCRHCSIINSSFHNNNIYVLQSTFSS